MANRDASLVKQHFNVRIFKSYFDYIEKHYPHVDVKDLCQKAGLDYEYLLNENNWVSCVFNLRLMKLFAESIKDPNLSYKVGSYSVSRQGLGAALFNLGRNVFDIKYIYSNLWRLSGYLNKVTQFELLHSSRQSVTLKASFRTDYLAEEDALALRELIPHIVQNTAGYYSAMPRMKDLSDANVQVQEQSESFIFKVQFPAESIRRLEAVFAFAGAICLSVAIGQYFSSVASALCAFVGSLAIYGLIVGRRVISNMRSTAAHLEENIELVNKQYHSLQLTQEVLDRKYLQEKALSSVSNHLVHSGSEEKILTEVCRELCEILGFDRAVMFLENVAEKKLEYKSSHVKQGSLLGLFEKLSFPSEIESTDPTKLTNIFRYRNPVLIKNVKEHMSTLNEESQFVLKKSGSVSFLAVPIFTDSTNYGVMLVDNVMSAKQITEDDRDLLSMVGRQVALVLERVRAQNSLAVAYKDIEKLAQSYSRFVPFKLIDLVGFKSVVDIDLRSGKEYEMAVFFSDIRGFTSMSETMAPVDAVAFLNSYFSSLAPVFEKHNGIIDKFLGDGVMALFLSPEDALNAAIEFQRDLNIYNQTNRAGIKRSFIAAGIGLHFGKVLLGAVGYHNRMSISVTSDSVNLASRLDSLNKTFGVDMLCSGDFIDRVGDKEVVRFIGRMQVTGRNSFTDIYEIMGHLDRDQILERREVESTLRECVELMTTKKFEKAAQLIDTAIGEHPKDPVLGYYEKELSKYLEATTAEKKSA